MNISDDSAVKFDMYHEESLTVGEVVHVNLCHIVVATKAPELTKLSIPLNLKNLNCLVPEATFAQTDIVINPIGDVSVRETELTADATGVNVSAVNVPFGEIKELGVISSPDDFTQLAFSNSSLLINKLVEAGSTNTPLNVPSGLNSNLGSFA